jgi:hypothetical protein
MDLEEIWCEAMDWIYLVQNWIYVGEWTAVTLGKWVLIDLLLKGSPCFGNSKSRSRNIYMLLSNC